MLALQIKAQMILTCLILPSEFTAWAKLNCVVPVYFVIMWTFEKMNNMHIWVNLFHLLGQCAVANGTDQWLVREGKVS